MKSTTPPIDTSRLRAAETIKVSGMRIAGWQTLAWTLSATTLLFLVGLGNHGLWGFHEPYVGGIIREMASSGDWVVPTLNGHPYLEKPPLYYALGALACRLSGSYDVFWLRLPAALTAIATIAWMSFLGWRLSSARAGGWAGFMVGTSELFFRTGHSAVVDMGLTAAVSFGLGLGFLVWVEPHYRRRWAPLFWVAVGCSFMAKSFIGPVLILLPMGLSLLLKRDRTVAAALFRPNWGMALGLAVPLYWLVLLYQRGGGSFMAEVILRNTLGRFLEDPELVPATGRLNEHSNPFSFYFSHAPSSALPWVAMWGAGLWSAFPKRRRHPLSMRSLFLPLAFAADLLLLSLSDAKRGVYLLPVLPITLLQAALWLDLQVPKAKARIERGLTWVIGFSVMAVGLLGIGFPWFVLPLAGPQWIFPLVASLIATTLSALALRLLWQRRFHAALDWIMAQWTGVLLLFLLVGVPLRDKADELPLRTPYNLALDLEHKGARVLEAHLTETQLGFSSLAFLHSVPSLKTEAELRTALASAEPVVVLADALWCDQHPGLVEPEAELPTEASRRPKMRSRVPLVLVNRAAAVLSKA